MGLAHCHADRIGVRYRCADGEFANTTLDRLQVDEVVVGLPVREFRFYQGRRHYSGWYWSATLERMVVYESRLELARIMLADFDVQVTGLAAQPFQLEGADGTGTRRHIPDLLLVGADGGVTVVDVKAPSRLADPPVQAQFAWARTVCAQRGWGFEAWSGASPVLMGNVRFLAGYRRRSVICAELAPTVLAVAAGQPSIGAIERALSAQHCRELVRPVVLHLLWTGQLQADLGQPISTETLLRVAGEDVR